MKRREILAAAAGLIIGLLILGYWLSPRAVGWSPTSTEVTRWGTIRASFSQPIDPTSLAGRFTLSPDVEGQVTVEGSEFVFKPLAPFDYGTVYTLRLAPGLRAGGGLPMLAASEFSFTVAEPRLLYLKEVDGRVNLWRQEPGGAKQQLTDAAAGIWDYSVIPGGRGILLSVLQPDGTIDLVQLMPDGEQRKLLDCPESECRAAVWQPGGDLIAFERQALGSNFDETEVWLFDTRSGDLWPAHDPALMAEAGFDTTHSRAPRWSYDGRYLAYFKPEARILIVQDMTGDEPLLVAANMELMGGWSPVDYRLAYTELAFGQEAPHEHVDDDGTLINHTRPSLYDHLVVTDLAQRETVDHSQDQEVNEGQPAWSPDGAQIALGRTDTGSGRQIWLVPGDGGPGQALTADPFVDHAALSWSPDGAKLAFMRIGIGPAGGNPAVWILDLDEGEEIMVEDGAFMPGWLE